MRINTNMAALNAWRNMTNNSGNVQKSLEKLSSGFRINRAADDAAGLAVSEKMRAQIRGTNMAVRNAQDGISLVQTAEGALTETHSILQRMRELTVQASNSTLSTTDRDAIAEEINSLTSEVDRIGDSTKFNGTKLLDGTMGTTAAGAFTTNTTVIKSSDLSSAKAGVYTFTDNGTTTTISHVAGGITTDLTIDNSLLDATAADKQVNIEQFGLKFVVAKGKTAADVDGNGLTITANASANIHISSNGSDSSLTFGVANMKATGAGSLGLAINVTDATNAKAGTTALDTAIVKVSTERAKLGAIQNRLEHTVNNLSVTSENLSAAESRIRDVDMASEMATFTKHNILNQASQAMLAQANQSTQGILSLLR